MKQCIFLFVVVFSVSVLYAQDNANYDESKVPAYTLSDPLTMKDGTKVMSIKQWEKQRRPELMAVFSSQMYGRTPKDKIKVTHETVSENPNFLNGKATLKQVKFVFTNGVKKQEAILLLVLPNEPKGKVPVFVGYNFRGNHSTHKDPSIEYPTFIRLQTSPDHYRWDNNHMERGNNASCWNYELIIGRGYGVATMFYQDIYPDKPNQEDYGIVSLFPGYDPTSKAPDRWQAIGAWAWGMSRILDYLETQKRVDMKKIISTGHSRLGKTSLWAGAQDNRFKIVISNESGCGGAALSKRIYGETVTVITKSFPHWFCPAFSQYAYNELNIPFDQHELIALIAPRKVYIASAEEDRWADPKGEFLSGYHAGPVFELYGLKGLGTNVQPPNHQPIRNDIGYHVRAGIHDVTDYDWKCFMDFADKHLK